MERQKILLVDDDNSLLTLLAIRLRAAGFDVRKARNGAEALDNARHEKPQLVITDLRLGGMDGMTLFGRLHELYPWLPVIILTAHASPSEAAAAKRRGAFAYVTKPFSGEALLARIDEALQQGHLPTCWSPGERRP
jgi:two-component system response regulator GlrR